MYTSRHDVSDLIYPINQCGQSSLLMHAGISDGYIYLPVTMKKYIIFVDLFDNHLIKVPLALLVK